MLQITAKAKFGFVLTFFYHIFNSTTTTTTTITTTFYFAPFFTFFNI